MTRTDAPRKRVRLWLGEYLVSDFCAEAPLAERHAAAMASRFTTLQLTIEAIDDAAAVDGATR